jgi:hypothetical protein
LKPLFPDSILKNFPETYFQDLSLHNACDFFQPLFLKKLATTRSIVFFAKIRMFLCRNSYTFQTVLGPGHRPESRVWVSPAHGKIDTVCNPRCLSSIQNHF